MPKTKPEDIANISNLTSQIPKLGDPIATGSFGKVYKCTISKDKTEVAVKVFDIDRKRPMAKIRKGFRRELHVWLKLKHATVVPLLGVAYLDHPLPALVSKWMPFGTLNTYLEEQATTLTAPAKVNLAKGIADGLNYLHSKNVIHGDLHPANVLIDSSGNPCLTDFGLATVVGNAELQWTTTTAGREFNSRWRAPEVIGVDCEPGSPSFKSDIYSFGSMLLFIVSGCIPWKDKTSYQITIELSRRVTPARPKNFPDDQWILIQECWSWDPAHRPMALNVLQCITQFRISDVQVSVSRLPADLTGQIFGQISDYQAGGTFANVYRCEWRQPTGHVKVAVKSIRLNEISEQGRRRFRRETEIWAILKHDNIVPLLGTTEGYGPYTALVFPWFQDDTLHRLITNSGIRLRIGSKLDLLHGVASGLHYLHYLGVVHGDITSFNVMVNIDGERYHAYLADFGLATVLGGQLGSRAIEGTTVRPGAIRWTAPELLASHSEPTTQNDMYSFGCVMFHVLTLDVPWNDIDHDYIVLRKILDGQSISYPDSKPDVTDARWREITQCWSTDARARPSALAIVDFLRSELEALTDNDIPVRGIEGDHRYASLDGLDAEQAAASDSEAHSTQRGLSTQTGYHQDLASSDLITHHPSSSVSLPPLNVLLFGDTGVGKSSIINLIMGQNVADVSDVPHSVVEHTTYEVNFEGRLFKLREVSSIASMNFLRRFFAHRRLKKLYDKLYRESGVYLLLYCMRGPSVPSALPKDYKYMTNTTNRVPIAAVINGLEGSLNTMDDWWTENKQALEHVGMHFSKHACITSLSDDPSTLRSHEAICSLIYDSLT